MVANLPCRSCRRDRCDQETLAPGMTSNRIELWFWESQLRAERSASSVELLDFDARHTDD